jgi:hypothetical protein
MSRLLEENAEAAAWVEQAKIALGREGAFGEVKGAVIWSDAKGPDGKYLVPIDDPAALVAEINTKGFPLLKGHDPGFPVGRVPSAALFTGTSGTTFIAAVLGLYNGAHLSFHDLDLDFISTSASPARLPAPPQACWINLATDPREIESEWIEDVVGDAPFPVQSTKSSLNAADSLHELITVGVLFIFLVWNPFVTAIATEAGKDVYANMSRWLRHLFKKIGELRDPILEVQAHHNECYVSFIFRGTHTQRHYAAHDALPAAAIQAQCLIVNMKSGGFAPKHLVYEYHPQNDKWFPSYAELFDGRLVTDNALLIAVEQLPSSVSLGLHSGKDKPRLPSLSEGRPHAVLVLQSGRGVKPNDSDALK